MKLWIKVNTETFVWLDAISEGVLLLRLTSSLFVVSGLSL
jgi:hypothetical protein